MTGPVSAAELRVLQALAATGDGNKQIARRLSLATSTVHAHVGRMLRRIDCPTRTALAL